MTDLSSPEAQAAVERVTDAIHAHLGKWATREDANREAEVAVAALLSDVPCPECGGTGKLMKFERYHNEERKPCPSCGGTGSLPSPFVTRAEMDAIEAGFDAATLAVQARANTAEAERDEWRKVADDLAAPMNTIAGRTARRRGLAAYDAMREAS